MNARVAVVRDFRAEGWPSMDLCADQLLAHAPGAADFSPPFRRLCSLLSGRRAAFNADRLLNRHVLLPRAVRRIAGRFDIFHVADHTYGQVVTALPPGRAGVYCHDLDAFRCVIDPAAAPRPWWFRRLAHRTLIGLQRAAVVFHGTAAVREQILRNALVPPDRLVYAPYGVSEEFHPGPPAGSAADPFLLHVGGNLPRKRLDVLIDVFAGVREVLPELRLVQVGGSWTPDLTARLARHGVRAAVAQLRGLRRAELADLYRGARAVLVTSEAEGFGLPVIEALACGAAVVASDIPPLREVGGSLTTFCPVADVPAWVAGVLRAVAAPADRAARAASVGRYSWAEHARVIGGAYRRLAAGLPIACASSS